MKFGFRKKEFSPPPLPLKLDPKLSVCKNVGLVLLPPSLFRIKSENMNFFFWMASLTQTRYRIFSFINLHKLGPELYFL